MKFSLFATLLLMSLSCADKNKTQNTLTVKDSLLLKKIDSSSSKVVGNDKIVYKKDSIENSAPKKASILNISALEMINGRWKLSKFNNKELSLKSLRTEKPVFPVVIFNTKNKEVTGGAVCNSFQGNLEITEKKILINHLMTTEIACGKFESEFYKSIANCIYEIKDNKLVIKGNNNILEFVKD